MIVSQDLEYQDIEKQSGSLEAPLKKKTSKKMKIFIGIIILIALAIGAVGMYLMLDPIIAINSKDTGSPNSATPIKYQQETQEPISPTENKSTIDETTQTQPSNKDEEDNSQSLKTQEKETPKIDSGSKASEKNSFNGEEQEQQETTTSGDEDATTIDESVNEDKKEEISVEKNEEIQTNKPKEEEEVQQNKPKEQEEVKPEQPKDNQSQNNNNTNSKEEPQKPTVPQTIFQKIKEFFAKLFKIFQ